MKVFLKDILHSCSGIFKSGDSKDDSEFDDTPSSTSSSSATGSKPSTPRLSSSRFSRSFKRHGHTDNTHTHAHTEEHDTASSGHSRRRSKLFPHPHLKYHAHLRHGKKSTNRHSLAGQTSLCPRNCQTTALDTQPAVIPGLDFTIREDDLYRTGTSTSCPNSIFTHVDSRPYAEHELDRAEHPVRVDTSIGSNFGFA